MRGLIGMGVAHLLQMNGRRTLQRRDGYKSGYKRRPVRSTPPQLQNERIVDPSGFKLPKIKNKMNCAWFLILASAVALLGPVSCLPPPPQCTPGMIEEIPPRMRKVCAALSTIYELSSAMENYLDDKGPVSYQMMRENSPLLENGVKRQDVDHVFLRFGRRR
ncbi:neuropeptide receptor myosuppressin [Lycorma delicatula]|uniref:neuropeptide receptor myosuppressin n=1 Tax=Lycorma delicatula TaxID=130591 RepID=UPI003F515C61